MLSRKIRKHRCLEKSCPENLRKIHSEPCKTCKMEIFAKIVNCQRSVTIFVKSFSLDVC